MDRIAAIAEASANAGITWGGVLMSIGAAVAVGAVVAVYIYLAFLNSSKDDQK